MFGFCAKKVLSLFGFERRYAVSLLQGSENPVFGSKRTKLAKVLALTLLLFHGTSFGFGRWDAQVVDLLESGMLEAHHGYETRFPKIILNPDSSNIVFNETFSVFIYKRKADSDATRIFDTAESNRHYDSAPRIIFIWVNSASFNIFRIRETANFYLTIDSSLPESICAIYCFSFPLVGGGNKYLEINRPIIVHLMASWRGTQAHVAPKFVSGSVESLKGIKRSGLRMTDGSPQKEKPDNPDNYTCEGVVPDSLCRARHILLGNKISSGMDSLPVVIRVLMSAGFGAFCFNASNQLSYRYSLNASRNNVSGIACFIRDCGYFAVSILLTLVGFIIFNP